MPCAAKLFLSANSLLVVRHNPAMRPFYSSVSYPWGSCLPLHTSRIRVKCCCLSGRLDRRAT
jgi:hypothetical protein